MINNTLVDSLPSSSNLPVHIEHVLPNEATDCLTSRYDSTIPPETECDPTLNFQNVVITDVDGSSPYNELQAAAIRHVKKKGGGYLEIGHDPTHVNEFFNPNMFPM